MASAATPLGLLVILLLSLLSAAAARPCKTLFISHTFSASGFELTEIRATSLPSSNDPAPARIRLRFLAFHRLHGPVVVVPRPLRAANSAEPHLRVSSLRERARDVLVVAVGLLFGVGCGALTAATMYLAWSLVTNRYEICGSDGYDDEEDEVEVESPKKMGYVKIPAAAYPVPAAKEGYEGNQG